MRENKMKTTTKLGSICATALALTAPACATTPFKTVQLDNGYTTDELTRSGMRVESSLFLIGEYLECASNPNREPVVDSQEESLLRLCKVVDGIIFGTVPDQVISEEEWIQYRHSRRLIEAYDKK